VTPAQAKKIVLNLDFSDLKKQYSLTVENGVLTQSTKPAPNRDATITLTKSTLDRIA
jgi:alkyl sulfatase BDS1-like metallo-beta-lactamase superfamily hydrolase